MQAPRRSDLDLTVVELELDSTTWQTKRHPKFQGLRSGRQQMYGFGGFGRTKWILRLGLARKVQASTMLC